MWIAEKFKVVKAVNTALSGPGEKNSWEAWHLYVDNVLICNDLEQFWDFADQLWLYAPNMDGYYRYEWNINWVDIRSAGDFIVMCPVLPESIDDHWYDDDYEDSPYYILEKGALVFHRKLWAQMDAAIQEITKPQKVHESYKNPKHLKGYELWACVKAELIEQDFLYILTDDKDKMQLSREPITPLTALVGEREYDSREELSIVRRMYLQLEKSNDEVLLYAQQDLTQALTLYLSRSDWEPVIPEWRPLAIINGKRHLFIEPGLIAKLKNTCESESN